MEQRQVRVLIADAHAVYRLGLRGLLESQSSIEVTSETATGEEAVALAQVSHPTVAVVDVKMPGIDGIEATRRIKRSSPDTRVVVTSGVVDGQQISEAFDAGADSFVGKGEPSALMLKAVLEAAEGRSFLPPNAAGWLMDRLTTHSSHNRSVAPSLVTLTSHEASLIQLLGQGKRNREAAVVLGISERTVNSHVFDICRKLQVRHRADLFAYAVRSGLLQS